MLEQGDKLRPSSFASKVLARGANKKLSVVRKSSQITARKSARVEPQVIPVSPEDVPQVCATCAFFMCMYRTKSCLNFIKIQGKLRVRKFLNFDS